MTPERASQALRDGGTGPVGTKERRADVLKELRAVGMEALTDAIEHLHRHTTGVRAGLQHQRRDRSDEHRLRHPLCSVAANVAGDFAAAHRVTDEDRVFQIKLVDQLREVIGECIIFVAIPWLA